MFDLNFFKKNFDQSTQDAFRDAEQLQLTNNRSWEDLEIFLKKEIKELEDKLYSNINYVIWRTICLIIGLRMDWF